MRTNTSFTIYNKYVDENRLDAYSRTVIEEAFWDSKKAVNKLKSGLETADEINILVPFDYISDKEYIEPKEYKKLEDKSLNFTFNEGDKVVKGIISFEIVGTPKELEKAFEVYEITSVDPKDFGSYKMRHWKLGGR